MAERMGSARIGQLPPEANMKGGLNESTPPEQRVASRNDQISDGPVLGEKGEFKPATYKTARGNLRTDR